MSAASTLDKAEAVLPSASDGVDRWFEPLLAERLAQADMGTLGVLAQRINEAGARWWYPVRGMGVTRAARVVQWLQAQPGDLGLRSPAVSVSTGEARRGRPDASRRPRGTGSESLDWAGQLGALQPVEH